MKTFCALSLGVMLGISSSPVFAQSAAAPPTTVPSLLTTTNLLTPLPATAPAPVTNVAGGKIQFASTSLDFGKVRAGEIVMATYYFTNVGKEVLEIPSVQPTCGCTTAGDWCKKVEPGQSGSIPLQFDTHNYVGSVIKGITVLTSDKSQGTVILQLSGNIYKPIDVNPSYPILAIQPDSPVSSAVVQITNNMEQPLSLFLPEGDTNAYRFTLETNEPGRLFKLTIAAIPPVKPGVTASKVALHTSASDTPMLDIPFTATVVPPVTVSPMQIILPQAPLTMKVLPAITIMCNSTNWLTLSDPKVNADGVGVQINMAQTNKVYVAQLDFPVGFRVPADKPVVFTVKTSLPSQPLISIPVLQLSPPAAPGQPPALGPNPTPSQSPPQQRTPTVSPVAH
jgi:hypothetical protein